MEKIFTPRERPNEIRKNDVVIRRKMGENEQAVERPLTREEKIKLLEERIEQKEKDHIFSFGERDRRRDENFEYDGKKFERDILGAPDVKTIISESMNNDLIKEGTFKDGDIRYIASYEKLKKEKIFEIIKKYQGDNNPDAPQKALASLLRFHIVDTLRSGAEKPSVRYFTSVGTPIDHSDGIDFFFDIKEKESDSVCVTLDITLRNKKANEIKADILVKEDDIWPLHEVSVPHLKKEIRPYEDDKNEKSAIEIFDLQTQLIAEKIAQTYSERIKQKEPPAHIASGGSNSSQGQTIGDETTPVP